MAFVASHARSYDALAILANEKPLRIDVQLPADVLERIVLWCDQTALSPEIDYSGLTFRFVRANFHLNFVERQEEARP